MIVRTSARSLLTHARITLALCLLMLLTGLSTGTVRAAYTNNPFGLLDSCEFKNGSTILYGWAHDADALTGGYPVVSLSVSGIGTYNLDTYIAGYRDEQINAAIDYSYSGTPKGDTYGFVAYLPNMYKGGTYNVSGTILNTGPGTDQQLWINTYGPVDGDTSKPYFANNTIPQACLAPIPSNPTPPPPPTTTPTPTPSPTPPSPTPTPSPTPPSPQPSPSVTPPTFIPTVTTSQPRTGSAPAATTPDQSVTNENPEVPVVSEAENLWTAINPVATRATVTVFAKDLDTATLYVGKDKNSLAKVNTLSVKTNRAVFELSNLSPNTTYFYRVFATDKQGTTIKGQPRTIKTQGYKVALSFFQRNNMPAYGIAARLKESNLSLSAPTNSILFSNIIPGNQTVEYTYQGVSYTTTIQVAAAAADKEDVIGIKITVPLGMVAKSPENNRWYLWLAGAMGLLLLACAFGYYLVKRHLSKPGSITDHTFTDPPLAALPNQAASIDPQAPHKGQSLKEMILDAMTESSVTSSDQSKRTPN